MSKCTDTLDPIRDIANSFSRDIQRRKDALIMVALSAHLGSSDWVLDELKGRLECLVHGDAHPDKRTETYCIDGVSLITFHPQMISTSSLGGTVNMHAEVKYQMHIDCDALDN